MPAERLLPTTEAEDLIALVREICREELAPRAAAEEEAGRFPREALRLLGKTGLLGLPRSAADRRRDFRPVLTPSSTSHRATEPNAKARYRRRQPVTARSRSPVLRRSIQTPSRQWVKPTLYHSLPSASMARSRSPESWI